MMRYANGKPARLPFDVTVHLVARAYGTSPEAVRSWPADDFRRALELEPYIGAPRGE